MADEINDVYKIHENNWPTFKATVEKLNRKIKKLGLDYERFEILADPVGYEFIEDPNKPGSGYKMLEIFIAGELIVVEGWEFVARLRHDKEAGVMIDTQPGKECPVQYRDAVNTNCDHCHVRRYRTDTFVLRNTETNEYQQVGRSCLKDFYGHNIEKIAKMAEYWAVCIRAANEERDRIVHDPNFVELEMYLAFVARSIEESGWVSRGAAYNRSDIVATADISYAMMSDALGWNTAIGIRGAAQESKANEAELEVAKASIAYWAAFEDTAKTVNDFEYNLGILAKSDYVSFKDLGRAGAMVMSYQKAMNHLKTTELRKNLAGKSEHVGEVGDVLENMEFTVEMRRMFNGHFGPTQMTKMRDTNGNAYTVFGGTWTTAIEAGMVITMKRGRVKKHDEFRNEKQTVLTYVKQAMAA